MQTRREFASLINDRQYLTAVEVGVSWGGFSELLLYRCPAITLYSIDYWPPEDCAGEPYTIDRLKKYGQRSVVLIKRSLDAVRQFADQSLDFVYIDADHNYRSVQADIQAWYPKVRQGGILAGHDYNSEGVRRAVDEYASIIKLPVQVTDFPEADPDFKMWGAESGAPSWWFEKGRGSDGIVY